jgi:hypothetical protein
LIDKLQATVQTYVVYLVPTPDGDITFKAESRDPQWAVRGKAVNSLHEDMRRHAYAFFFIDRVHFSAELQGEQVSATSISLNRSLKYYIDHETLDIEAVRALPEEHPHILRAMQAKGPDSVVLRSRYGDLAFPEGEYEVISSK